MKNQRPRILCVDDDSHTCNWIRIMLRASHVDVTLTTVTNGREAFNLLTDEDFDLCILDYALPDMTGVQLCSLVRRMGSDVPVMFFTAMNRPVDKERAAGAGANEYLCKPDDLDIFVDAVERLLKRRRPIYIKEKRIILLPQAA